MNSTETNTKTTNFDFSRYNTYKKCPLFYKWKYIDGRLPKTPPNMYYALPGIVIQKIFEYFYNNQWYLKRAACREFMYNKAPEIYENTLKYCYVNWNDPISKKTKHQVFEEILEMIGKNLDVIKEKKLLGSVSKSEFTIISHFDENKYVTLKSKVDFYIHNQDGIQILDGKNTSNKTNYLKDPSQLYFYAMMHNFKYKRYPDKIGYWFWRQNSITYIDFNKEIISNLQQDIKDTLYKIYKNNFEAKPDYSTCLFCDYKDECFDRKKQAAEKQAEKSLKLTEDDLIV